VYSVAPNTITPRKGIGSKKLPRNSERFPHLTSDNGSFSVYEAPPDSAKDHQRIVYYAGLIQDGMIETPQNS